MEAAMRSASSLLTIPLFPLPALSLGNPIKLTALVFLFLVLLIILIARLRYLPHLQKLALHALRRNGPIPSHIAFIMDGNRRWARRSGLESHEGHPQGGEKLIESLQWCLEAGVRHVTVYAFSIENFKRPAREVDEIFQLALHKFHDLNDRQSLIHEKRVRVRVLGNMKMIPKDLRAAMASIMEKTRAYAGGPTLNICFAYTARYDMAGAVCEVAKMVRAGEVRGEEVTEETIGACLATGYARGGERGAPYPQLLVRTSGETRLSDFLLWETADAVLAFYPVLWPDLTMWDFVRLLLEYQAQCDGRKKGLMRRGICEQGKGEAWTAGSEGLEDKGVAGQFEKSREEYFEAIRGYRGEAKDSQRT